MRGCPYWTNDATLSRSSSVEAKTPAHSDAPGRGCCCRGWLLDSLLSLQLSQPSLMLLIGLMSQDLCLAGVSLELYLAATRSAEVSCGFVQASVCGDIDGAAVLLDPVGKVPSCAWRFILSWTPWARCLLILLRHLCQGWWLCRSILNCWNKRNRCVGSCPLHELLTHWACD